MRRTFGILALSFLAIGCGSDSAPLKASPGDAALALDASAPDTLPPMDLAADESGCWQPNYPLPAPVTCSTTVQACDAGADSCLSTSAGRAIARLAQACGMTCGELEVGFVAGCAAEHRVVATSLNLNVDACVSKAILGQRWTCTPENGWVRVYLGSCTLA